MARRAPPPTPPAWTRLRGLFASPLGRSLLRVGLFAVLLLTVGGFMRQVRARAFRLPGYRLSAQSIRFADLPDWADARMVRQLSDPAGLPLRVSVFDPRADERVREVVASHPMVRDVRGVQVVYPNVATVRVHLRRPVAAVRVPGGGLALLADDRHVLDPEPYDGYLRRLRVPMPIVEGVRSRPPRPGLLWEDRDEQVAEALEAARVAARLHHDLGGRVLVTHIDVARFPASAEDRSDGEIRFRLQSGRVIEWGRTERDATGTMEAGYATKARRLEEWLDDPNLSTRPRIDVRYRMPFEAPSHAR